MLGLAGDPYTCRGVFTPGTLIPLGTDQDCPPGMMYGVHEWDQAWLPMVQASNTSHCLSFGELETEGVDSSIYCTKLKFCQTLNVENPWNHDSKLRSLHSTIIGRAALDNVMVFSSLRRSLSAFFTYLSTAITANEMNLLSRIRFHKFLCFISCGVTTSFLVRGVSTGGWWIKLMCGGITQLSCWPTHDLIKGKWNSCILNSNSINNF